MTKSKRADKSKPSSARKNAPKSAAHQKPVQPKPGTHSKQTEVLGLRQHAKESTTKWPPRDFRACSRRNHALRRLCFEFDPVGET